MKIRIENEWGHQIIIDGDIKAIHYVDADEKKAEDMLDKLKREGQVKLWHFNSWKWICMEGCEPETDKWVDKIIRKSKSSHSNKRREINNGP